MLDLIILYLGVSVFVAVAFMATLGASDLIQIIWHHYKSGPRDL